MATSDAVAAGEPGSPAVLVLTRTFAAPPERVFRAWTEPEQVKQWLRPQYGENLGVEVDLRVGGSFNIAVKPPVGPAARWVGTYLEVEPPQRLVYTFGYAPGPPRDSFSPLARLLGIATMGETRVTVEFQDRDGATEVRLTHELLATRLLRSLHRWGWTTSLERLAELVGVDREEASTTSDAKG